MSKTATVTSVMAECINAMFMIDVNCDEFDSVIVEFTLQELSGQKSDYADVFKWINENIEDGHEVKVVLIKSLGTVNSFVCSNGFPIYCNLSGFPYILSDDSGTDKWITA